MSLFYYFNKLVAQFDASQIEILVRLNGVTLATSKSGQLPKMSGQRILGNVHTNLAGYAIKFAVLESVQGSACA